MFTWISNQINFSEFRAQSWEVFSVLWLSHTNKEPILSWERKCTVKKILIYLITWLWIHCTAYAWVTISAIQTLETISIFLTPSSVVLNDFICILNNYSSTSILFPLNLSILYCVDILVFHIILWLSINWQCILFPFSKMIPNSVFLISLTLPIPSLGSGWCFVFV